MSICLYNRPAARTIPVLLSCGLILCTAFAQALSPAVEFLNSVDAMFAEEKESHLVWIDPLAPPDPIVNPGQALLDLSRAEMITRKSFTEISFASSDRAKILRDGAAATPPPLRVYGSSPLAVIAAYCEFTGQTCTFSETATLSLSSPPAHFTVPSSQPLADANKLLAVNFGLTLEAKGNELKFDLLPPPPLSTMREEELLGNLKARIDHHAQFPIYMEPAPDEIAAVVERKIVGAVDLLTPVALDEKHPWGDEARVALNNLGAPIPARDREKFSYVDPPIRAKFDSADFAEGRDIALAVIDQAFLPFAVGMYFRTAEKTADSYTFTGAISGSPGTWSMTVFPGDKYVEANYKIVTAEKTLTFDVEKKGDRWLVMKVSELD
ncbi:MAG TPA: hypothetical protein PK988_07395 [Candidatus Sumerlaeota bacterium]|nr:hypothetical protein [Candidatus Sumerlaeota bacterium]